MRDCGATPDMLEAAYFGNAAQGRQEGQHMIVGSWRCARWEFRAYRLINVENASRGASTAMHLAYAALQAGQADVVLAVGAEKMVSPDKSRMFGTFDSAWDVATVEHNKARLARIGRGVCPPQGSSSEKLTAYSWTYTRRSRATTCLDTARRSGRSRLSKNHAHSVHNPPAQFRRSTRRGNT